MNAQRVITLMKIFLRVGLCLERAEELTLRAVWLESQADQKPETVLAGGYVCPFAYYPALDGGGYSKILTLTRECPAVERAIQPMVDAGAVVWHPTARVVMHLADGCPASHARIGLIG